MFGALSALAAQGTVDARALQPSPGPLAHGPRQSPAPLKRPAHADVKEPRVKPSHPETAAELRKIQVRWIARRGIVRKAEEEMSRLGHMFRGRTNNIYARNVTRALTAAERATLGSSPASGNRRMAKRRSTMSASVQVALMSTHRALGYSTR